MTRHSLTPGKFSPQPIQIIRPEKRSRLGTDLSPSPPPPAIPSPTDTPDTLITSTASRPATLARRPERAAAIRRPRRDLPRHPRLRPEPKRPAGPEPLIRRPAATGTPPPGAACRTGCRRPSWPHQPSPPRPHRTKRPGDPATATASTSAGTPPRRASRVSDYPFTTARSRPASASRSSPLSSARRLRPNCTRAMS